MSTNQMPWLAQGDKLFKTDSSWQLSASLDGEWDGYTYGYKAAGDVLVEHALSDAGNIQDALVFPIVFVYRQYLELQMKKVMHDAQVYLALPVIDKPHHRLTDLWCVVRPLLSSVYPRMPQADLDNVQDRIAEFSLADPASTRFRYPFDKTGQPSHPRASKLDLRNLMDVVDRLAGFFEGCEEELGEMWAAKCDESFREDDDF